MKIMKRKIGYHAETVGPRFVIDKMEKEMKKNKGYMQNYNSFSKEFFLELRFQKTSKEVFQCLQKNITGHPGKRKKKI